MERHPPANVEAEEYLLGCLISNPRHVAKVIDILKAEHFVEDTHSHIYRAIDVLYHKNKACTLQNVRAELLRQGTLSLVEDTHGSMFLERISMSVEALGKAEDYADAIKQASVMRRLYSAGSEIMLSALHQDEDALERAEELIASIVLENDTRPVATLSEVLGRYMTAFDQRRKDFKDGKVSGVPTGFRDLDGLLGGLQPSRLHVIAARPSLGKTALALNIALNIIQHARHVLFFSLEMDEDELAQRLLSMETPIDQSFLRDGDVDDAEAEFVHRRANELSEHDMKLDDHTYTLSDIRSKAIRVHGQKKLDLIVVDYLQMIDVAPADRRGYKPHHEEVAEISRRLKRLARELKVPVIALAQLNRKAEEASAPQLSHLGESDGIGRDADVVMFIHCDEVEMEKRNRCEPYRLSIITRKHRNGAIGTVDLIFKPRLTKFQDMQEASYDETL